MTLEEIKAAVRAGKTVHWVSSLYKVINEKGDYWSILCTDNNYCIGLTHTDEVTMNGKPEDFYIDETDT